MDVFDGLCGQPLFPLQFIIELLDLGGGKLFQLDLSKSGLYMVLTDRAVRICRVGLDIGDDVSINPGVQPLPQGLLGRRNISSFVQVYNNLREFLADFFLCFAADRALNLLSGPQVITNGSAGFIVGVLSSISGHGFLANGAVAVGGTAHGFCAWHISSLSATQTY